MCDECGRYFCPSSCPEFSGFIVGSGSPRAYCSLCEQALYRGESYYLRGKEILCEDCAEALLPSELLDFLDCSSPKDFFEMLCVERREA